MQPSRNDHAAAAASSGSEDDPPVTGDSTAQISRLKRQKKRLENENAALKKVKPDDEPTPVRRGRKLCRLVDLCLCIDVYIEEEDRRREAAEVNQSAGEGNGEETEQFDEVTTRRQERYHQSYKLMCKHVKGFERAIEETTNVDALDHYFRQLEQGAHQARTEDYNNLREPLMRWLNQDEKMAGLPQLDANNRIARGFAHDFTGHMLTPVEYDWSDENTRERIRNCTLNCANSFFVNCLYAGNKGDPNDVEKGYLRNGYLAYKYIFTSPSSAISGNATMIESGIPIASGDSNPMATKRSNAANAKMEGVTGRSIAYVAVLFHLNLTSASKWTLQYNRFDYPAFYQTLVDYLEVSESQDPEGAAQAKAIIKWWNQRVFPGVVISDDNQSEPTANFLATVRAQRRGRATAATEGIST